MLDTVQISSDTVGICRTLSGKTLNVAKYCENMPDSSAKSEMLSDTVGKRRTLSGKT